MKLIICLTVFFSLTASALDESIALKLRACILSQHQSFLDVQNNWYPHLSKQLIKLSFKCAEKRDKNACAALVKGVNEVVEKQAQDCAAIVQQATAFLIALQRAEKTHTECLQQKRDAALCEQLDAEKKTFFRRLAVLNQEELICLGFRAGELSPLAQCESGSCASLIRELYDRAVFFEHLRSPLHFHARMLDYAVREYRLLVRQAGKAPHLVD